MTSFACKLKQVTGKYFKLILKKTILIWNLWESKGYGARQLIRGFSRKNWKGRGIKNLLRKVHETGLLDLLTGSGRPRTSRSCVVQHRAVADWWYSWPMANTLASLCLSQRQTFWTYVMTVNLFSLYLMNFMFHTMLDAAGVVLRVHYKSMKCDVLFSQGSVRTIFRWGGHFFMHEQKIPSSLQQCKKL